MWLQANPSTHRLTQRVGDRVVVAEFNHNARAKVSDEDGEILLAHFPSLKKVKDGGPAPKSETESEPAEAE